MFFKFDRFNRIERPQLILCEISKKRIGEIETISFDIDIKYNNISEIHFSVPNIHVDGSKSNSFDEIKELRMVYMRDFGWFQIRDISEKYNDGKLVKECVAYSAECLLQCKYVVNLEGDYKLYDPIKPYNSLLGLLLIKIPGWKIGTIDSALLTRQRTLNINKQNVYSLLTNDVAEAYECIFVFDFDKYIINIVDVSKKFKMTSIYLSYHNLIKNTNIKPLTDKIITALIVKGGGDLDISGANPNGSDIIYNVDYFKDRMSPELLNSLNIYENKYKSLKVTYSDLMVQFKNKNSEMLTLNSNPPQYDVPFTSTVDGTCKIIPSLTIASGLDQLKAVRKALENVRSVRIEKGNIPYTDVNAFIIQVDNLINQKQNLISTKEQEINTLLTQISNIVVQLKMENNFTEDEWIELNAYFIFDTFQDNTFIWTDIMTQEEKYNIQQELFEFGTRALERAAYPRYKFEIDSVNFLALPEFKYFNDQFELGTTFTLDLDYYTVNPILLGVHINFDDYTDFKLIYGNKSKLDDSFSIFDFSSDSVNTSNTISFDLVKLEAMKKQYDDVSAFLNGSLDATLNNLISSKDKTVITIDEKGLRVRSFDYDTDKQLPYEAWWTGTVLAFSDDNFTTSKAMFGRIVAPGSLGGYLYGINAQLIGGNLLCGNFLRLSNEKNNFLLDDTGCFLTDAEMVFKNSSNTNSISIDSKTGVIFKKGDKEIIKMDINTGDASFTGSINMTSGNINWSNINETESAAYRHADEAYNYADSISVEAHEAINALKTGLGYTFIDGKNVISPNIIGGSITANTTLNVGRGNFIVDSNGNVTLTGTINATSGNFGGSINVNNRFTVNSNGDCFATSFNMAGGSINYGNLSVNDYGNLSANNAYIKGRIEADSGYFHGRIEADEGYFRGKIEASEGHFSGLFSGILESSVIYSGVINANQITTGKLTADYIDVDTLYVNKIAQGGYENSNYVQMFGSLCQFYANGSEFLTIYNSASNAAFSSGGVVRLSLTSNGGALEGNWTLNGSPISTSGYSGFSSTGYTGVEKINIGTIDEKTLVFSNGILINSQ